MGKLLIAQAARSATFEISGVLDREETLAQIRDQLKRNQSDNAIVSASPQEAFCPSRSCGGFFNCRSGCLKCKKPPPNRTRRIWLESQG